MSSDFAVLYPNINNDESCELTDTKKCEEVFDSKEEATSFAESIKDKISLHFQNTKDACSEIEIARFDYFSCKTDNHHTVILEEIGICNTITDES